MLSAAIPRSRSPEAPPSPIRVRRGRVLLERGRDMERRREGWGSGAQLVAPPTRRVYEVGGDWEEPTWDQSWNQRDDPAWQEEWQEDWDMNWRESWEQQGGSYEGKGEGRSGWQRGGRSRGKGGGKGSTSQEALQDRGIARLHVANLPRNATEDSLRSMFQPFGSVLGVKILATRGPGVASAIVRYGTSLAAEAAIATLHGKADSRSGSSLVVQLARPNAKWGS